MNTSESILTGPINKRTISVREAISQEVGDESGNWLCTGGEYDHSFKHLITPYESISSLAHSIYDTNGQLVALDLMGYGQALRELPGSGLAVALSDIRSDKEMKSDNLRNNHVITGNVLHRNTWNEIDTWLDLQSVEDKKFNLILCHPSGGFVDISLFSGVHKTILERVWEVTSSNNGVILTQIPSCYDEEEIVGWTESLKLRNIDFIYKSSSVAENNSWYTVLSLTKNPDSGLLFS